MLMRAKIVLWIFSGSREERLLTTTIEPGFRRGSYAAGTPEVHRKCGIHWITEDDEAAAMAA
jgi:hypothetical protein